MTIEFKENPFVAGNIKCLDTGKHVASIDGYDGEITWLSPATVSGRDRSTIYAKAESVTNLASF